MEEICRYQVDALNRIVWIDDGWLEFAQANEGGDLCEDRVIRRPLFDFVADLDTVHVYRLLLDRVRSSGDAIVVPFRCDSPGCRRDMVLRMVGTGDGHVAFESLLLRAEPRDYVALLDSTIKRKGAHFVKVCGWCKQVRIADDLWLEVEEAIARVPFFTRDEGLQITHGMCPACFAVVKAKIAS